MGSSVPQEQQVREKVQKGWLSRWTRKQWSRHWFVLKNGSITYYRGPAAELCSFLDGVLDLSLIKHIEVPQQVEKARPALSAPTGSQKYAFNYQQNLSQYQQHHHHQQQQQQVNSRFDFTLKMWNGECHVLSAASAAERQSWLAAIHSCGSFDDSTSDSSASSDSSMSAKSTDIGKPTGAGSHVGAGRNPSSTVTSTTSAVGGQTHAAYLNSYHTQQQQEREAELSLEQLAFRLKSVVRRNNANRYQEQESLVEKQSEQKQQFNSSQIREQQQTKPSSQTGLLKPAFASKANQGGQDEEHEERHEDGPSDGSEIDCQEVDQMQDDDHDDHDEESSASEREAQLMSDRGEQQAHKRNLNSPKSTSEPKLLKRHGGMRQTALERPVGGCDEEAEMVSIRSDTSSGLSIGGLREAGPTASRLKSMPNGAAAASEQPAAMQRQKKRVTFDLSNQDLSKYSRIDRDLSSSSSSDSSSSSSEESCSSSPSSSSDEAEDEPKAQQPNSNDTKPRGFEARLASGATSSLGSVSPLSSSDGELELDEDLETSALKSGNTDDNAITSSSNEAGQLSGGRSQLLDLNQIREIEQRRKLELKKQLSYSSQRANDEDEDSTCELVRRMIERRKLRLLSKQQREIDDAPAEGRCELEPVANLSGEASRPTEPPFENSSATSGCRIETNEEATEHRVDSTSSVGLSASSASPSEPNDYQPRRAGNQIDQMKQLDHIGQLEDRLESAQLNIKRLEQRLNDSYLSYSQLELSYNQLQVKLAECQQVHSNSLMQTQSKIDELTRELEASQRKLLEAKDKLLKYEEHLAKWQQQSQSAADAAPEANSSTTPNSASAQPHQRHSGASRWAHQKTASWLMKNSSYLAAAHHNLNNNHTGSHLIASQHPEQLAHQPLLLMHQLKQTLSMNQQQLSLKLLNQSRQIQRKLNELESKVDRIQATDCKHFAARSGKQANLSPASSEPSQ